MILKILLCLLFNPWYGDANLSCVEKVDDTWDHVDDYGIKGQTAPELRVEKWIDADGLPTDPLHLADLEKYVKVIYCFQAWCPGCHSRGLPAMQKLTHRGSQGYLLHGHPDCF